MGWLDQHKKATAMLLCNGSKDPNLVVGKACSTNELNTVSYLITALGNKIEQVVSQVFVSGSSIMKKISKLVCVDFFF